jgi:hypothetical protein
VERTAVHLRVREDTASHPHFDVSFDVRGDGVSEIDVERLAEALSEWWSPIREHLPSAGTYAVDIDPTEAAAAIAAEYARLPASDEDEQLDDGRSGE